MSYVSVILFHLNLIHWSPLFTDSAYVAVIAVGSLGAGTAN